MTSRLALVIVLGALCSCRQQPATRPTPQPAAAPAPTGPRPVGAPAGGGQQADSAGPRGQGGGQAGEPAPRPYNRVITSAARSKDGLFKTHQVGSRVYFEIPRRRAQQGDAAGHPRRAVPVNQGYGGQQVAQNLVLRWERRDNKVYLRRDSYETVADSTNPIYQAVRNSNNPTILAAFNVEAYGPDSAAVIDVTRLYTAPPPEFVPGPGPGPPRTPPAPSSSGCSPSRPTWTSRPPSPIPRPRRTAAAVAAAVAAGSAGRAQGTATIVMHWSMVAPPRAPDDASAGRQAHRLLQHRHARLRPPRAAGPEPRVHRALAAGEEGPERRDLRAGQADRLLRGP